jgi:hypothetical protein
MSTLQLIDVDESNVAKEGFFCRMSKMKTEGNQKKLAWLKARFAEGLKIKMFKLPQRGFIEYIPGEYAWRTVDAKGYMFIHCLWVVGQSKGKGLSKLLVDECERDAKNAGMNGVAMMTNEGNWLVGKTVLENYGYESVGTAPPSFNLMVKKFKKAPTPVFTNNWEANAKKCGNGLTIFVTSQCPYLKDTCETMTRVAKQKGIKSKMIELKSAEEVRALSPSPYGVFNVVLDGKLFSYHYLLEKEFLERLAMTKYA